MDVKKIENFKVYVVRLMSVVRDKPLFTRLVVYPIKFVLGILLSKAVVFGGYAPFGLGYAAALGATRGATFGIVGAILGYFSIIHKADGLKYIACCILIYTAAFVFRETRLIKTRWFMPASALVSAASVGIVFVADSGFIAADIMMYASELVFVAAGAYFFQLILNPEIELKKSIRAEPLKYSVGMVAFLSSVLIPLSEYYVFKTSPGHVLAVYAVMLAAYFGGLGAGSCIGVMLGLSVGIVESTAFYSAVFGFSGIAAGIFRNKGKMLFAVIYASATVSAMLWLIGGVNISLIYGVVFAGVLFLVTGELFGDSLICLFADSSGRATKENRVRVYTSERLKSAASAFSELSRMLGGAQRDKNTNDGDIASIYDRAASRICRKCILSNACWEKDYLSTKDALNGALNKMLERGQLKATDFPLHFSSRCVMISDFIAAINKELNAYMYRRQYKNRIAESRNVLYNQYRQISHIFEGLAGNIESEPVFEERMEILIRGYLKSKQIYGEVFIYRDVSAHLHLHIEGVNLSELFRNSHTYTAEFSNILGVELAEPQCRDEELKHAFITHEREELFAVLGVAVNKKNNSDTSGDSGSYFKLNNGRLCVILSDGMGSGKVAATESAASVGMLEKLVKSGIEPKNALMTVHSALTLKSEQTGCFSTLDFLSVDLYNGETLIYKLGGAPTYIKRCGQVRRVTSNALPAGVTCGRISDIEETRLKLCEQDFVVMASDGVADKNDDAWLREYLSGYSGASPKSLAGDLLAQAYAKYGRADDMTVMVVSIRKFP